MFAPAGYTEVAANSVDAAVEKHVPVVELQREGHVLNVTVGEVGATRSRPASSLSRRDGYAGGEGHGYLHHLPTMAVAWCKERLTPPMRIALGPHRRPPWRFRRHLLSSRASYPAQDAGPTFVRTRLMCGVTPGALVDYPNYEHDLLRALDRLAAVCDAAGVACIVPAVLSLEVGQLFEAFLLRRGRVVPLRLTMIRHQEGVPVSPWSPPVFDIAGTRIAVTFDAQRDLASLPGGCDLLLLFPVNGLDVTDCDSAAAAALPAGQMTERVARAGIWMACMAPIGGYDDAVYTGGSYVLDDGGRVVALAPCFEESLLVQDARRLAIPRFDRGTVTALASAGFGRSAVRRARARRLGRWPGE